MSGAMFGRMNWMNKVKTLVRSALRNLVLIAIGACAALLATVIFESPKWEVWDRFIEPEPIDVPVVLSTKLTFDESGAYTGEIRRSLQKAGFRYRIIDRAFPKHQTVVSSTSHAENVRREAKHMLNDHGGDVLIYGAVGAKPNTISIQFFGRDPDGFIECGIEINVGDENWSGKVIDVVEAMATESGLEQFLGSRGRKRGMSLDEFMEASERKLAVLNEVTDGEFLKERTELGIETVRIARAKIHNDVTTIREIRQTIEEKVGKTPRVGESHYQKMRIMGLADLYMVEGLMEGKAEKIDEGMRMAIGAGFAMLEEGMKGDDTVIQKPHNATSVHWLLMTILVLACDDEEAMRRLELLLLKYRGGPAEQECMTQSDAFRMLWPLTILNDNPNRAQLEGLVATLAEYRDFGMGKLDHWQDPFLHARRQATRRLAYMDTSGLGGYGTVGTKCRSLGRWMEMKGWMSVASQG